MIIANYMNDTTQEYKGKFPLVLFSFGCNLSCPKCYNKHIVSDPSKAIMGYPAKLVIDENLTPLNKSVVFLGGEPTIWDDLPELCKYVKDKGLLVKVFTNGMNPDMIEFLNEKELVDAYSVDFKAIKDVSEVVGVNITDRKYLYTLNRTLTDIKYSKAELEIRTTKWANVKDLNRLTEYIKYNYPNVPHIFQDDMLEQKLIKEYVDESV